MAPSSDRRAHADTRRAIQRGYGTARTHSVFKRLALCGIMGALLYGAFGVSHERYALLGDYLYAIAYAPFLEMGHTDRYLTFLWQGYSRLTSVRIFASNSWVIAELQHLLAELIVACGSGVGLGGIIMAMLAARHSQQQESLLADQVRDGTEQVSEKQLARLTKTKGVAHPLRLGTVTIPPAIETRHLAMIGTTGSGKTTALRQLLDVIEARGDAALVYDTSGEFISHYYDPARSDVILNPFDQRGAFWNPFDEITHPADADRIARYLVKATGNRDHDVWLETARILVANILRTLWDEKRTDLATLHHSLQSMTREELEPWLAHTSSSRTFAADADRATGSVIFMLTSAADTVKYLRAAPREGEKSFSISRHIAGLDEMKGRRPWIFVPRKENHFEGMKPLMALWLECAASAMLGLTTSSQRRMWFILDELADLPKVDNLARLLPEGRKFGAAVILTFQAIGQMRSRYGADQAEAMLGCCNSKLFLQLVDQVSREWASDTIGSVVVDVPTPTDAIDPETGAVRASSSLVRQTRPAVLESAFRLAPHTGFLLLPDGKPVAQITLTDAHIHARGPARHVALIPDTQSATLWDRTQPGKVDDGGTADGSDGNTTDPKTPGPV